MKKHKRPSWREYFFQVMNTIAQRATCDRGRSGCVIVRNNQLVVAGYVGAPPGFPHCDEKGHHIVKVTHPDGAESEHCIRTLHAEMNAVLQAARLGISLLDTEMYCSLTPCRTCAMMIIRVGIKAVHCERKYHRGQAAEEMFKKAGIKLTFQSKKIETYEDGDKDD